jgi:hypothetical protein
MGLRPSNKLALGCFGSAAALDPLFDQISLQTFSLSLFRKERRVQEFFALRSRARSKQIFDQYR